MIVLDKECNQIHPSDEIIAKLKAMGFGNTDTIQINL